jgi:WD40 repeat protein
MPIHGARFSPDSRTVFFGAMDGTAQLWDVLSGKKIGPSLQVGGQFPYLAFSPDGKTVLACAEGNTARLWDTTTGELLGLPVRLPPQVHIMAIAIQPAGKIVLMGTEGSADNIVCRWDAATRERISPP